jgi:hypothetical protein
MKAPEKGAFIYVSMKLSGRIYRNMILWIRKMHKVKKDLSVHALVYRECWRKVCFIFAAQARRSIDGGKNGFHQ